MKRQWLNLQQITSVGGVALASLGLALALTASAQAEGSNSTNAAGTGFQVSPRLGITTLSLDADALKSGKPLEKDAGLAGVTLGYVSPFIVMGEVGYTVNRHATGHWSGDDTDVLQQSEYTLVLGAQFNTPHGFRITPKVGRAKWKLSSSDDLLTFTDPNSGNRKGYDNFWELSVQKQLNSTIALGVLLKDNDYAFGNVKTIAVTASFSM